MNRTLPLAGFSPMSTVDWEGQLVSTVFTQGCPLACVFCHNDDLIPFLKPGQQVQSTGAVEWATVLAHMDSRRGLLDGLVFSGGEPLAHGLLPQARQMREMGFKVGIHTSGMYPRALEFFLAEGLVDWVGLDVKTGWGTQNMTGVLTSADKCSESLTQLRNSSIDFEVRTTIHPEFMTLGDAGLLLDFLTEHGQKEWVIQQARGTVQDYQWTPIETEWLMGVLDLAQSKGVRASVRGAEDLGG